MADHTYENCYKILEDLRHVLDEHSDGLVQATDTSGAFKNAYLITEINRAMRYLFGVLFKRKPEQFISNTSLTASSSVLTLPWDFAAVAMLRDSDGNNVLPIDVHLLHSEGVTGSKRLYRRVGNTLVIDQDSVSDTYTLYYYSKPREITMGQSSAGGALSLTLASSAKAIADYYNGMTIENVTDGWTDTISDYSAARVATLAAQTGAGSKFYGIVPEIPEPLHHLIAPRASIHIRSSNPKAKNPPTPIEIAAFSDDLAEAINLWGGMQDDIPIEEIFEDFQPQLHSGPFLAWGD